MGDYHVYIGHAVCDERGKSANGKAGDSTGNEVKIANWYLKSSEPWLYCYRPIDKMLGEKIADTMVQACKNEHIGYNQNKRTTAFEEAKKHGFRLYEIDKDCETDCSALVALCLIANGVDVSKDMYTGNEKECIEKTGKFRIMTDKSYLLSQDYLRKGDILQKAHHTCIVTEVRYVMHRELRWYKGTKILKGPDVRKLQKRLEEMGYAEDVTGSFGKKTEKAVKAFQYDYNLKVDGIMGKLTAEKLGFDFGK